MAQQPSQGFAPLPLSSPPTSPTLQASSPPHSPRRNIIQSLSSPLNPGRSSVGALARESSSGSSSEGGGHTRAFSAGSRHSQQYTHGRKEGSQTLDQTTLGEPSVRCLALIELGPSLGLFFAPCGVHYRLHLAIGQRDRRLTQPLYLTRRSIWRSRRLLRPIPSILDLLDQRSRSLLSPRFHRFIRCSHRLELRQRSAIPRSRTGLSPNSALPLLGCVVFERSV